MFSGAGSAMAGGGASGPVNYDLARQLASSSIGFTAPIPDGTSSAIADAVRLAETWLDGATALPAGTTKALAWTPNDWIDNTLDTWKRLCDPVAQQISTVWASALPDEAKSMAGPLLAMISQMGGMAFGSQLGQALGTLSREVLTSTDIGLPLGPNGVAALMPQAVEEFSAGLEQPRSEILTFLAAREAAHHRLFSHVPWLSTQLLNTVEAYAKGISIDMSGIEELAQGLNPATLADPSAMEQTAQPGHLRAQGLTRSRNPLWSGSRPCSRSSRAGWRPWSPRRSATGCPVRPRCPRRCAAVAPPADRPSRPSRRWSAWSCGPASCAKRRELWERLTTAAGVDARDAVWQHPDLLPDADDLDEPAGFIDRVIGGDTSGIDSAIDEALEKALDEGRDEDRPGTACG